VVAARVANTTWLDRVTPPRERLAIRCFLLLSSWTAVLVVGKLCSSRRQQNALASAIKE